ncbi:MAG: type VI secretion system tip protein VgrG [Bacteroidota bacterium]
MSETIYSSPTDQIEVDIVVEGNSILKEYPAVKVVVEKKINDIPKASFHIIDGDPTVGDESFKAATGIAIKSTVEIKAGYKSSTETIFKGIISGKNTEQDKNGNPVMIVECTHSGASLKEGKKTTFFKDKSDADVINGILSDASIEKSVTISCSASYEQLVQFESSDWDFIKKRAQINGCIIVSESNKLTIDAPKTTESPERTLKYGSTIKEQSLTLSDVNQIPKVTAQCWDPAQQKMVEATATEPTVNAQSNVKGTELAKDKSTDTHALTTSNFLEKEALKAWADAYLLSLRLSRISGRINTQGDSKLKPNTTVKLEGFGKNFNGNGYIGAVKHTILPGDWETEITLGLPETTFNVGEQASESRVPTFTGLQIGVVKQIHEDPENTYRVLVEIPAFPEIKDSVWARLASPYAPKEKGWFFYPEVGDELVVGFVEGHPSNAIILGSVYSKKNTAPYTPDEDNSTKAIVTKGDLKIEFNDKDIITTISTPEGNQIELSEKDKKITITDQTENTITLSEDGIVIKSKGKLELTADKDVTIKGKGIKIEASNSLEAAGKDIKLKAKMALEGEGLDVNLKGKKAVAIEGKATAELKASGQTSVKGAILKLN